MKELEERIRLQGTVKPGNVLKVDAFLNHQCDVELFDHMGAAWAEHFAGKTINKDLSLQHPPQHKRYSASVLFEYSSLPN